MSNLRRIGRKMKELRECAKKSQQKLADDVSLSRETIAAIEQGRRNPTIKTLEAIIEACGATLAELFDGIPVRIDEPERFGELHEMLGEILDSGGVRAQGIAVNIIDLHRALSIARRSGRDPLEKLTETFLAPGGDVATKAADARRRRS